MKGVVIRVVVIFSLYISSTFSIEESFCAGTGYSNLKTEKLGLTSMGYSRVYKHPVSTVWGSNHCNSLKRSNEVKIQLYPVVQTLPDGSKAQLNGWLSVVVNSVLARPIYALAIWALTDTRESTGEFVSMEVSENCTNWKHAGELLPCSAAPIDATRNPNMFVYTDKKIKAKNMTGFKLLWRMSSTYCNKPNKFRFLVATNSHKWHQGTIIEFMVEVGRMKCYGPLIYTTPWLIPKFYGAAANVYDNSTITCPKNVQQVPTVWLRNQFSTMTSKDEITLAATDDLQSDRWTKKGAEIEDTVIKRATCKAASKGFVAFGGRCTESVNNASTKRVFANPTTAPLCLHVKENFEPEDLTMFKGSYMEKTVEWANQLLQNCECPKVPTAAEVKGPVKRSKANARKKTTLVDNMSNIQNDNISIIPSTSITSLPSSPEDYDHDHAEHDKHFMENNEISVSVKRSASCAKIANSKSFDTLGICVHSTAGQIVYGVRQFHAGATLFCTLVLVPIASYMARYHKGSITTIGSGQPHIPIKAWYIVHILIVLPILCLYIAGMMAMRRQRGILGYSFSIHAKFHRYAGIALLVLIALQVLTGFLRPQNIFYRKVAIWAHFISGLIINYGGLVICIMTYKIPGSPTSFRSHVVPQTFNPISQHLAPMILTFWGALDISYHIFLTAHVMHFDKLMGTRRPYFPVILPAVMDKRMLVDEEYEQEESFKKGALVAYVVACLFIYSVTCMSIYHLNNESDQGYGPMYCTHDATGKFFDPDDDKNGKIKGVPHYCHVR